MVLIARKKGGGSRKDRVGDVSEDREYVRFGWRSFGADDIWLWSATGNLRWNWTAS